MAGSACAKAIWRFIGASFMDSAEEYMRAHPREYDVYRACLLDTFGPQYVEHLDRWLEADGLVKTTTA